MDELLIRSGVRGCSHAIFGINSVLFGIIQVSAGSAGRF